MSKVLLDTDILSDILKGKNAVVVKRAAEYLASLDGARLLTSRRLFLQNLLTPPPAPASPPPDRHPPRSRRRGRSGF